MITTYSTFEAFRPHFNALAYVAYFKIVPKSSSGLKHTLHTAYRAVVWFLVIIYNLQHVIRVIQARHSMEQVVNTLFVLLTTLNTLGKQMTFTSRVERMDRLIGTIQGSLFTACNAYDEKVLRSNAWIMSRLLMMYHGSVYLCGVMWGISPLVTKLSGEVELTGYFPFDTSGWIGFGIAVAFNTIVITLQAYAHGTMDCTIVSLHAQTKTQLQMLRNSLEHLVDPVGETEREICVRSTVYRDIEDPAFGLVLKKRLTRCVEHYKLIVWFHNEVEAVFAEALMVQFFVAAWVICMTVYKIVGLSLLSAEFFSMFVYLGVMMAQLFIYCYYGTQVKAESEFINHSICRCDWVSLSPRFRALLLILMSRGMRPVAPRIAHIIPMSLETYISVLRSSYTLFTFLERK
ncbi:odorant receptor Or1-like [Cydia strobilella]|uniref:odorant receptor Or1-like n=1 Tax=Cydia strobilella TaxID=1100964 RepID=UPI003003AE64